MWFSSSTPVTLAGLRRVMTAALIGEKLQPITPAEEAAEIEPVDLRFAEGVPNRYQVNVSPGVTDMTVGVQSAFNVCAARAASTGSSDTALVQRRASFLPQDYLCNTVTIPGSMIIAGAGWASRIIPHPSIPDGGAVFLSLSGGAADATSNRALLTAIYGAGNEPALRREYDLSGLEILNLSFIAQPSRAISAIWLTGLVQSGVIRKVRTRGFKFGTGAAGGAIRLNGSWVFAIEGCSLYGESLETKEGTGLVLGSNTNGSHLGATQCNSFAVRDTRIQQFSRGLVWRRGSVARLVGNDIEFCTIGGVIQAGKNFVYSNYHEGNVSRSLELGGTGAGEDNQAASGVIEGNLFNESGATERVKLRNIRDLKIRANEHKGDGARDITLDTGFEESASNEIELTSPARLHLNGATPLRADQNRFRYVSLPPHPRAMVRLNGALSIPHNADTAIAWTTEAADLGEWWAPGAPTVFTVPAGVSNVRVALAVIWASNSVGTRRVQLLHNGTVNYVGRVEDSRAAQDASQVTLQSAVLPVNAGDTFAVRVFQTSGGALDVQGGNASYFAIEAVG